ncbi:MAG: GIY-YIG nuclease family protein [Clostridia bacterium]|nr:GIY-YIG nuclease family protein [Clostridia bacterium]
MATKAKTIKMLLYDGTLNGVTNISDSAWAIGNMYSAPRESINALITKADCKRYGVYLLLSDKQVYVGQSSDLEKRTKQHLTDKDWWDKVILMTTKDDSFNASDIDYLEAKLIGLAAKAGTSDSDNKKKGNPQKVDEFRQAELEDYLEEALFLMELIGVRVFVETKEKSRIKSKPVVKTLHNQNNDSVNVLKENPGSNRLPDSNLKIGEFVYTAMRELEKKGYSFSEEQINAMCTPEWSIRNFHTRKPFMKKYIQGVTDNKGDDGRVRFRAQPFVFGKHTVYLSKEWYERQRELFVIWYNTL